MGQEHGRLEIVHDLLKCPSLRIFSDKDEWRRMDFTLKACAEQNSPWNHGRIVY